MNRIHLNVGSRVRGYEQWSERESLDTKISKRIAPRLSCQKDGNVGGQRNKLDLDKKSRESELYKTYRRDTSPCTRTGKKWRARD